MAHIGIYRGYLRIDIYIYTYTCMVSEGYIQVGT